MQNVNLEQEIINLSKEKWRWMSECDIDALDTLFHKKSVFVHMKDRSGPVAWARMLLLWK